MLPPTEHELPGSDIRRSVDLLLITQPGLRTASRVRKIFPTLVVEECMQNTSIAVAIERSQPRIIFADSHLGELALHLAELKPDRLEWVHLNVCSPLSVTVLKARDFKVTTHIGLSRSLTDSESRFLEMEEFLQQIGYLNTNGTAQKTTNEANDGFACFLAKLRDWARAST